MRKTHTDLNHSIEKILKLFRGRLICTRKFRCCLPGFAPTSAQVDSRSLCRAKQRHGAMEYLQCLEENPGNCGLAVFINGLDAHLCTCPLRKFIHERLEEMTPADQSREVRRGDKDPGSEV